MSGVRSNQRFRRARPCPICGGGDDMQRGKEKRCHGFLSTDEEYAHCSREELAGGLEQEDGGTYSHRLHGPCRCGSTHGEARSDSRLRREIIAEYDYRDENGALLFQVVRFAPKDFRQRRPDGLGGWVWQLGSVRRVPYLLPELLADDGDRPVYVVEGEKDVEAVRRAGFVATCNPGGAGKWAAVAEVARAALQGREVVVVADADAPGRSHAADVLASLQGVARAVRVVEPPAPYKDVAAMLDAGLSLDRLEGTAEAAPENPSDMLAPELPFDEIWTAEPEAHKVIPWLGIVPGPAHLVSGSWYTGKTLLLMTLGLAVASGRSLFGLHQVQRGRWVHFDHEMGRRGVKRYVQRLCRGLELGPDDLRDHVSLRIMPRLNLTTEDAVEHYTRILTGCTLATIDPLRAAAPGQDENKSEFRQWLDMLATVSNQTNCAIVVLHHGGKPVEGQERRNTGRGTSAIDDAVQSKFVLTAKEKGAPMLVSHEKTRENNGLTVDDFYLEIDSQPDSVRLVHRDKEEMASRLEQAESARNEPAIERAQQAILKVISSAGGSFEGSRDDIRALVAIGKSAFDPAWVRLTKVDRKLRRGGSHNEPVWSLQS